MAAIGIRGIYTIPAKTRIFVIDGIKVKVRSRSWCGNPNGFNCFIEDKKIFVMCLQHGEAATKAVAKYLKMIGHENGND